MDDPNTMKGLADLAVTVLDTIARDQIPYQMIVYMLSTTCEAAALMRDYGKISQQCYKDYLNTIEEYLMRIHIEEPPHSCNRPK